MSEGAADRRTVDVYVKDAEKDADSLAGPGRSGEVGTVRGGSRKNQRKNAARSTGAMLHAQLPVAHASTIATASKLKP